jgi:hypothetical protein
MLVAGMVVKGHADGVYSLDGVRTVIASANEAAEH